LTFLALYVSPLSAATGRVISNVPLTAFWTERGVIL
jgi:hypothetical protein